MVDKAHIDLRHPSGPERCSGLRSEPWTHVPSICAMYKTGPILPTPPIPGRTWKGPKFRPIIRSCEVFFQPALATFLGGKGSLGLPARGPQPITHYGRFQHSLRIGSSERLVLGLLVCLLLARTAPYIPGVVPEAPSRGNSKTPCVERYPEATGLRAEKRTLPHRCKMMAFCALCGGFERPLILGSR